ncbi:MAG TPA: FAD binding domain-containing protein [Candidatus Acidoferrum sp.]|nr:FAD binding domain-containing protein [Candidatus Acidoferrum sp.]
MLSPGRAIVVGGSLGGLLAANLLLRAGWDVHVYERAGDPLAGRGAGIVTHPELLRVLDVAGVDVTQGLGVHVPARLALGRDGSVLGELPLPQLLTSWSALFAKLRTAFPDARYHAGRAVIDYESLDNEVRAELADGSTLFAELLIAADGFRSAIRRRFLPMVEPQYAGYVAWRGTVEESALSPAAHAVLFERFAFCLPPSEQILGYPIAGEDDAVEPGRRRFNFVWYRPADDARLRELLTDANGREHAEGIPPHLVDPRWIARVRADAERILAPQFAEVVRGANQLFFQPIYDLASPKLVDGRAVLLGDAAFVARPHCGMGVTKAAGDAEELVRALGDAPSLAAALAGYEQRRRAFGDQVIAHARHLGAYMQAQVRTEEERMMAERYRDTDRVLRETAVPFEPIPRDR